MLRVLRITGIVIFAVLVGVSSNTLWKLYESGDLFDQYNSARKTNITLLGFSVVSVAALGYFELLLLRKGDGRNSYGRARRTDEVEEEEVVDGLDSTNIYSAPKTIDDWQGRKTRSSMSSRHGKQSPEVAGIWMVLLRVLSVGLPVAYATLLVRELLNGAPKDSEQWLFVVGYSVIVSIALVAAIGLLSRKPWGLPVGYLLSVCNLLVFPIGTVVGLFLIVGLVGATPLFVVSKRERHHLAARKARRKSLKSVMS